MSDFDDLLGGGDEPTSATSAVRRGRPTNAEREARMAAALENERHQAEIRRAGKGETKVSEEEFLMPCSQNFLARVLRMDPMTVKKRLMSVKPAGTVGNGRPVYYFHEALPYLVKPKMDIGTYLKTLNPTDMPNSINKTFWEAERIKNKVLLETGEAWHDSDVLEILGVVFMMFKDRIPLITEGMRDLSLSDEQNTALQEFTDQLQKDLHEALVEMPKKRRTLPRLAGINPGDGPMADGFYDEADADDVAEMLG